MSASYKEEGVDYYVAKSGELKDMGSTWRGLTDEEKSTLTLLLWRVMKIS